MKKSFFVVFSAIAMLFGVNISASADDFDSSQYFSNLDFESCTIENGSITECTGWTLGYDNNNISTNWPKTDDYASSSTYNYMLGVWANATISANTKVCSQTSTSALPAGTYTVTVLAHADGSDKFALYATAGENTVTSNFNISSEWADAATYSVTITLESSETLEIGIMTTAEIDASSTAVNLYADNFTVSEATDTSNSTDISTSAFSNLDFESCTIENGSVTAYSPWNLSFENISTNWPKTDNYASSSTYNYMLGVWDNSHTIPANTKVCSQTSSETLPAGSYTVSVVAHADGTENFALYATAGDNTVTSNFSISNSWSDAANYSVTIELTEASTLEIGIMTTAAIDATSTAVNLYADNFTVTQTLASDSDGDTQDENADDNNGDQNQEEGNDGTETVVNDEFTNLDFESCTWKDSETEDEDGWYEDCPGWTINYEDFDTNWPKICDDWYSSSVNNAVLVVWNEETSIAADTKVCSQIAKASAGTYKVSVVAHADGTSNFALYATSGETTVSSAILNSGTDNWDNAASYSVKITLDEDTTLEIGIITTAEITAGTEINLYADNFSVTAITGDEDEPDEGSLDENVLRVVGGDISLVPAYEEAGDDWLDAEGLPITDNYDDGMITYLRDVAGWTSMRVRLLVDPTVDDTDQYNDYLATCQDIDYVKALGKRIKDAGMYFLLDIFYSDTWTDVSQQWIPSSWNMDKNTETSELAAKVKSYTTEVINELVENGAAPDYVQIGNEVSYGMLWDAYDNKSTYNNSNNFYPAQAYSSYQTQAERFAALLNAAAEGVRESDASDAKIVLHSERTINSTTTKNFYDYLATAGFTDYDVIGLSYYPAWQGTMDNLKATLSTLTTAYPSKEIQIVETGYYNTDVSEDLTETEQSYCTWDPSPTGQAAFLSELTSTLNDYSNVTGLYYWQPEECGNGASSDEVNRVKNSWDYRGFWEISWKSASHQLTSETALMTLQEFNHTALDIASGSTTVEATDISDVYFDNLDFESCTLNESGWVGECPTWEINYNDFTTRWPVVKDEYMSSLVDGYVMETWESSDISADTKVFYQTSSEDGETEVELPAGTYTITAVVHADGTDAFALYASADGNTETYAIKDSGSDNWSDAATYKVTIELTDSATLEIGIMVTSDIAASSTGVNLYADNFKVTQVVAESTDSESGDTSGNEDGTDSGNGSGENSEGGETTGIDTINAASSAPVIYNLQGLRLNSITQKGLYIVNGKKVLVK